jgi:hypothetical protein
LRQGITPPKAVSKKQLESILKDTSAHATAAFQKAFAKAQAKQAADSEHQRRQVMTREQRGREATEWLAKELIDWERKHNGNYLTYEEAYRKIQALAEKSDLRGNK